MSQPTEELPTEERPAEERPAEELPTEERPAEERPAEDLPAEQPIETPVWEAFATLRRRITEPMLALLAVLVLLLVLIRRISSRRAAEAAAAEAAAGDGDELPRMSFWDHLDELRRRLTTTVLVYTVAFFVCWAFARPIYAFLALPIENLLGEGEKLVFLKVTDPFFLYMKVAGLTAVFVSAPLIFYQVWSFVEPGLYKEERSRVYKVGLPFVAFATLLFVAGGIFGYTIAFPFALEFLLGVGEPFEAAVTVQSYFGFMMTVILGLGLMFELPAILMLLAWLGVVTPGFLLRQSRTAIVLIFVVAALITPTPDVFNLCLFALPTIALYFLGILLAWLVQPQKAESEAEGTSLEKVS